MHPGFIGFPWLGLSELTRVRRHWKWEIANVHQPFGRLWASIATAGWNRLVFVFPGIAPTELHGPTHTVPHPPRQLNRAVRLLEPCDLEAQTAPKTASNKGLRPPSVCTTLQITGLKASETALLSSLLPQIISSGPRVQAPEIPGRAKHSSLRQLPVPPSSRAERT